MGFREPKILLERKRGQQTPTSTGITFEDEGVVIGTGITTVNIVGTGHNAMKTGPNEVTIFAPEVDFVSHFNTSDGNNNCSVGSISTTNRYISNPASEGTPFSKGDWVAGTLHPATQSTTWSYTTTNQCLFDSLTSTLEVNVYDADEITKVATKTTPAITGNYDDTSDNIRIQVTSWDTDYIKYKGIVTITISISLIISSGGRITVEMIHHNDIDYTKTQTATFYDPNPTIATLSGVTIVETAGSVVTRFLSGVEYYTTGSQFTVDITDIDNLNYHTYPLNQVDIEGSEYGLPTLDLSGSDLTGWTYAYDDANDSYNKTNWAINASNFCSVTTTANINARPIDWTNGSWVPSSNANILVNTRTNSSTRLIERFDYEDWRCPSTANFDSGGAKSWDSTVDVGIMDAVFRCGGCERNTTDFTIYSPNLTSQPDYSGSYMNTEVFLWRQFEHDGTASANFRINIVGSYNSLEMKLAKAWDGTSGGGTVWIDCLDDYNASDWNNGNPVSGGCRVGSGSGYIDCTFGTNNIVNCSDTVYIRVGFTGSERITSFSITFN